MTGVQTCALPISAVPPLLVAVADDSWPVRQAAVEQLAAFRLEVLLPSLEDALRDGENASVRNAAMEIYVRVGPAAAAPLLVLLRDADEEVRQFSAVMLGSLKDLAAVVALIGALIGTPSSEERRVGKECCTPCRSRWSPYH